MTPTGRGNWNLGDRQLRKYSQFEFIVRWCLYVEVQKKMLVLPMQPWKSVQLWVLEGCEPTQKEPWKQGPRHGFVDLCEGWDIMKYLTRYYKVGGNRLWWSHQASWMLVRAIGFRGFFCGLNQSCKSIISTTNDIKIIGKLGSFLFGPWKVDDGSKIWSTRIYCFGYTNFQPCLGGWGISFRIKSQINFSQDPIGSPQCWNSRNETYGAQLMVQLIQLMVQKMCPYRIMMIFLGEITHENTF